MRHSRWTCCPTTTITSSHRARRADATQTRTEGIVCAVFAASGDRIAAPTELFGAVGTSERDGLWQAFLAFAEIIRLRPRLTVTLKVREQCAAISILREWCALS